MSDSLLASLDAAVAAAPEDDTLRLHLAELLVRAGRGPEAVAHLGLVLSRRPGDQQASQLMRAALGVPDAGPDPAPADASAGPPPTQPAVAGGAPTGGFDWTAAEDQVADVAPPMFAHSTPEASDVIDVQQAGVRLSDVGGLEEVKARLEASFLAPLRNPELRKMYGVSLRGGLLMYGPPGCGKTFLARAVAGELSAKFIHVSIADVLDMFVGQSERNMHELFEVARASAPCVLFLDEVDAIGQKRSLSRGNSAHNTVNQLLTELDGVAANNEGLYVLAATNQPWDVDPALRRPGRFDRTVLVLPPDEKAREAILITHLRDKPIGGIDVGKIAARTRGFSGADLAHLVRSAVENALLDSARTGTVRLVSMADLESALASIRPSIGPWMDQARNVALFANSDGEYDELAKFIRQYDRRR